MRRLTLATAILAAILTAPAAAQTASYAFFGPACGNDPVPLSVSGVPAIGTTFVLQTRTPVVTQFGTRTLALLNGTSNSQWAGLPLPFSLSSLSTPAFQYCGSLLVSVDVVVPVPWGAGATLVDIPISVPNNSSLLGVNVYQQVAQVYVDRNTRITHISTSQGGVAAIGR